MPPKKRFPKHDANDELSGRALPYSLGPRIGREIEMTKAEVELFNLEPTWGLFVVGMRTGFRLAINGQPLGRSLQNVHASLNGRHKRATGGSGLDVLLAVRECAVEGLPLPSWAAQAFIERIDSFNAVQGKAISLDTAFGLPPAYRNKYAARRRLEWELGSQLYMAVREARTQHRSFDAAVTAVLKARDWGVRRTKAKELLHRVDRVHADLMPKHKTFSRIWAKTRKP